MAEVAKLPTTALQQAQQELQTENNRLTVGKLKGLLKKKQDAELVVSNIQREIEDCIAAAEQGDTGA